MKILSRWFILSFLLTLLAITMALESNHEIYTSYELIHETETIEDAHELASVFDLSLVEHTNYGFSIFESSDPERKEQLLHEGFELNQKLKTTANFPIFSDEDPYLDDQYAIDMMDVNIAGEYVITYMINDGELTLYRYVNVIEKA